MAMKRWITGVAVAFAVAFGMSTGASANVIETATINVPGSFDSGNEPTPSHFTDQYAFTLSGADGNLDEFTTIFNSAGANIDISSIEVSLYSHTMSLSNDDDPFAFGVATFIDSVNTPSTVLPSGAQFTLTYLGLQENVQYFIQVLGDLVDGADRGNYSVNINVSNVPLPPAIWLFLSALVGLVSFARIRRRQKPA